MLNPQVDRLAQRIMPITFCAIVILSTLYHFFAEPLSKSFSWKSSIEIDAFTLILIIPALYHSFRTMGRTLGLLFFFTITVFMSGLEALWVSLGKLKILGDAYDYTTGVLWLFNVPLMIGLGWFLWIYAYYYISNKAFSDKSPIFRSAACGLLCVCTDLWMDPSIVNFSYVSNGSNLWNWSVTKSPTIFTVPIYNFLGWLFAGTFLTYLFQTTWASTEKEGNTLRRSFSITAISWLAYAAITKTIQFCLDTFLPNIHIFSFNFVTGEKLNIPQKATLIIVPVSMLACISLYLWEKRHTPNAKWDFLLFITYSLMIAFNIKMAYAIQIGYPSTFIAYLTIPMAILFAFSMYRLISNSKTPESFSK